MHFELFMAKVRSDSDVNLDVHVRLPINCVLVVGWLLSVSRCNLDQSYDPLCPPPTSFLIGTQ